MLADERFAAAAKEAAQNEGNDDDVVELPRDGNEIGHEVERQREVTRERDEESLLPPWDARVAKQAAAEDDAVRNEPGERPGPLGPACDYQRNDEQHVEDEECAEGDEKPFPQTHAPEGSRGSTGRKPVRRE
jgi:hypothetical protein